MRDGDEWSLGDEPEARCPECGKRNRPGVRRCVICGTALEAELEADRDSLRTLGEVMGSRRRGRRAGHRWWRWAWQAAALGLLAVASGLYWVGTREERHLSLPVNGAGARPLVGPTAEQRAVVPSVMLTPVAGGSPSEGPPTSLATLRREETPLPNVTAIPPIPRATRIPPLTSGREGASRAQSPPSARPPVVRVPSASRTPGAGAVDTMREAVPRPPSASVPLATERPSLGSDLREATRAYRAAIDIHNARVDEYNAIVDEVRRRRAWGDDQESLALRARLERARAEVERTRADAEALRVRMEQVRARYR